MSSDDGDRRNRTDPPADEPASERRGDDHGTSEFGNGEPGNTRHGQSVRRESQQPVAGTGTQTSIGDILQEPDTKAWVKAIAGSMAVVGIGLGVLVALLGALGKPELGGPVPDAQYRYQLVSSVFQMAPYLGFAIATVAGLLVGFHFDATTRKRLVTAAASALVGLVALVMLAEILASTQAPAMANVSLDYAQALINSVVLGVVAAIMSGGSAYFASELDL